MFEGGAESHGPDRGTPQPMTPAQNNDPSQPTDAKIPDGAFDPFTQPDIVVWAHDDTAQAGKTYRYALKYILSNPVNRTVHVCKPAELANQFYMASPLSAWSEAVSVESDTNFYASAATAGAGRAVAKFDVFRWKEGIWQMQQVQVGPGDMVGSLDPASKIDFTTGWTLVDIRDDVRGDDNNKVLLLVSENGTVLKKELITDQQSGGHHQRLTDIAGNKPAPK